MNRKTKLILMISSFCFVFVTCLFSVFAVKTFNFNIGGSIEFVAPGVNATVSSATLDGISSKTTGKMQSFSVTRDDTATTIAAKAGVQSWSGLQLLFDDDSEGKATIKFTITNTSQKAIENIMVELSTSTTSSSAIQATPSADFCIAPGGAHEFTVSLAVVDPEVSALVNDFVITVELKVVKPSEVLSADSTQQQGNNKLSFLTNSSTKTAAFSSYSGTETDVEIPAVVKDNDGNLYTVTEIQDSNDPSASPFCSVKSTLKSITFPSTLTKIGDFAFFECTALSGDLIIPDSVETIGMVSFYACTGFNGSLVIGNRVATIGNSAFCGCNGLRGDLVIPDNVITIGSSAFSECAGFTGNLIIGDGVTTIGDSAFYNCSGFTGDLIIGNSVATINVGAFNSCSGFTGDLIIPDSVTTIGDAAFMGCKFNGSLILGSSLITIGIESFRENLFTGDLIFPNSIKVINHAAFVSCTGFDGDLVVGNGISELGSSVFNGCLNLASITILAATPPSLGGEVCFEGISCDIFVPTGSVDAYKTAKGWSTYADRITAIV